MGLKAVSGSSGGGSGPTTNPVSIAQGGTGSTSSNTAVASLGAIRAVPTKRAPLPTDDSSVGYSVNDLYNFGGQQWVCVNNAVGLANWQILQAVSSSSADLISTAPLAAYGVFRLKSSYSGYAFKLTRASDSATLNVPFDVNGIASWAMVDAFAIGTTVGVSTWYDQSGNGYDVVQATQANMPQILGSKIGSMRAITFGQFGSTVVSTTSLGNTAMPLTSIQAATVVMTTACINQKNALFDIGNPTPHLTLYVDTSPIGLNINIGGNNGSYGTGYMSTPGVVSFTSGTAATTITQNNKVSTNTVTVSNTAATGLLIGNTALAGNYNTPTNMCSFIVYNSNLSAANLQTLKQSLYQTLDIQPQVPDVILWVGDSLVSGVTSTGTPPDETFINQSYNFFNRPFTTYNCGVAGDTIANMLSAEVTGYSNITYKSGATNIAIICGGSNDFATTASNVSATVYANLQSMCSILRTKGFKVVVCSLMPRQGLLSGGATITTFETNRQAYETLLKSGTSTGWQSFADGFIDFTGDPTIGPQAVALNSTYFLADNTHPTSPLCSSYMAAVVSRSIQSLVA